MPTLLIGFLVNLDKIVHKLEYNNDWGKKNPSYNFKLVIYLPFSDLSDVNCKCPGIPKP